MTSTYLLTQGRKDEGMRKREALRKLRKDRRLGLKEERGKIREEVEAEENFN